MALSIWVAVSANWPEYGMIRPTLIVPCAQACAGMKAAAASTVHAAIGAILSLHIVSSQALELAFLCDGNVCHPQNQFWRRLHRQRPANVQESPSPFERSGRPPSCTAPQTGIKWQSAIRPRLTF